MHRYYLPPHLDPTKAPPTRVTLRRAWGFVRRWRSRLVLYFVGVAAASALQVVPPLLFKLLVDTAIPERDLGAVNLLAAAAVGVALVSTALVLLNRQQGAAIGEGVIYDLRVALYGHVQRLPLAFFTRAQTGALLNRLHSDVVGAQGAVMITSGVLSEVVLLVSTLVAMLALSWQVTLLSLFVLPLFFVVDRRIGPQLKRLTRERLQLGGDMSSMMNERFNVAGAALVKLFGRPDAELRRFSASAADVRDTGVRQAVLSQTLTAVLTLIGAVGTASVYWWGARAVVGGDLALGSVVALAAYVTRLYSPLTSLAGARLTMLTSLVAFERCFEVLDAPITIAERPDATPLPSPARGRVEADDVWFRFPAPSTYAVASLDPEGPPPSDEPSDWVLSGVSFVAEPGTVTAVVGPSGAGKTTLAGLVTRLHDVTEGVVRIDGHDVRDLTLGSLTGAIGVVTQDSHMFHASVAENLRYARPEATDAELVAACRAARIGDVIAAMPDGYDTIVGERGFRLSGGEKQRLAIARVLLKDPSIVLLDEATAHLDSETEQLVQQALAAALEGRTAIVIAHRLSTIQAADQILVLDGGRIVERGRHGDLVALGGLYAELHETQSLVG